MEGVQAALSGHSDRPMRVLARRHGAPYTVREVMLDRFVRDSEQEGGPVISTDENLYLEHATPKGNVLSYSKSLNGMIALLHGYRIAQPAQRHLKP